MKYFFLTCLLFVNTCIFSQTIQLSSVAKSAKYGYSKKNAIKVGTIPNEYVYLALLRAPNGEKVTYVREGTCCQFPTTNSPFGKGLIDVWVITMPDGKQKKLYINGYDYEDPKCPKGFSIGKPTTDNK